MNAGWSDRPWVSRLISVSVRRPGLVTAAWSAAVVLAGWGVARLDFDTSTESVLNHSDPAWGFYRESIERFGGDESIVIAVQGKRPYDPAALDEVAHLTRIAQDLPGVRRVDSLASVPLIQTTADGTLSLEPALQDGVPQDDATAAELASKVAVDRIARENLVSADGRVFAVNLLLEADLHHRQAELLDQVGALVDPARTWVSGVPVFRTHVNDRTRSEILIFVPVTVCLIALFLRLVFRSWVAPLISLASSGAGMWLSVGMMGFTGTPMTISTMILPSILLAMGSAYSMHVLHVATGVREAELLVQRVNQVGNAIVLSGLTTAIGFVSLGLVRIDVVRHLGAFGSLGVIAVLLATLTLVPAWLRLLPLPDMPRQLDDLLRGRLRRLLVSFLRSHGSMVIGAWIALAGVACLGVARLQVETDATRWFPRGSEVRESYERIREHLSGISPMNVVVEGESVARPDLIRAIDAMRIHLESLPEVGKALSVADPLAQLHKGLAGAGGGTLPESVGEVEEYLLLLDSVDYLRDVVSWDRKSANLLLRVDNNGSDDLVRVARTAERWWAEHGLEGFSARTTGIMHEFARSEDEIAWGQLRGIAFAAATIGALLFLIFRWPLLAGIAMVPNVVPLLVVFGGMGILGVPLDAVTVALGSTALGIAVDDTIHLISRFRAWGRSAPHSLEAMDASLHDVLPPVVYTTVAIAMGFGILALSNFTVTQNLGVITAGVMALCLVGDLTLLPALLVRLPIERMRSAGG